MGASARECGRVGACTTVRVHVCARVCENICARAPHLANMLTRSLTRLAQAHPRTHTNTPRSHVHPRRHTHGIRLAHVRTRINMFTCEPSLPLTDTHTDRLAWSNRAWSNQHIGAIKMHACILFVTPTHTHVQTLSGSSPHIHTHAHRQKDKQTRIQAQAHSHRHTNSHMHTTLPRAHNPDTRMQSK